MCTFALCACLCTCVRVCGRARERKRAAAQYGCEKDVDGGRRSFAATECGVKRKRGRELRESGRAGERASEREREVRAVNG